MLLNVLGAKRGFIFTTVIAAGKKIRTLLDKLDASVQLFSSLIAIVVRSYPSNVHGGRRCGNIDFRLSTIKRIISEQSEELSQLI